MLETSVLSVGEAGELSSRMQTWHGFAAWLLIVIVPTNLSAAAPTCARPELVSDTKFAPGQVWTYQTRPDEESSTLTILRVERTPKLGTIVHIRVDGVRFGKCNGTDGVEGLPHSPFQRAALEASVSEKVRQIEKLPNYQAGYDDWLTHCGGAYSISVKQVIDINDAQYKARIGCR